MKARAPILIALLAVLVFVWVAKFGPQPPKFKMPEGSLSPWQTQEYLRRSAWPHPKNFPEVLVGAGFRQEDKKIFIRSKCAADYLAVLIFKKNVDYRVYPHAYEYNSAEPCKSGEDVYMEVDISKLNLQRGSYYYFFADQSESESWENPRYN